MKTEKGGGRGEVRGGKGKGRGGGFRHKLYLYL